MSQTPFGEITVTLADGRTLRLRRDLRAMAVAEIAAGVSMSTIADAAKSGGPQLLYGAAIFLGTLRAHHPEMTIDNAFDILTTDGPTIMAAMDQAASEGSVQGGQSAPANPPKPGQVATRGTGTRSTRPGAKKA